MSLDIARLHKALRELPAAGLEDFCLIGLDPDTGKLVAWNAAAVEGIAAAEEEGGLEGERLALEVFYELGLEPRGLVYQETREEGAPRLTSRVYTLPADWPPEGVTAAECVVRGGVVSVLRILCPDCLGTGLGRLGAVSEAHGLAPVVSRCPTCHGRQVPLPQATEPEAPGIPEADG